MSLAGVNWFVLWEESLPSLAAQNKYQPFPCKTASTNPPHHHHLFCLYFIFLKAARSPTFPSPSALKIPLPSILWFFFSPSAEIIDHVTSSFLFPSVRRSLFLLFPARSAALCGSVLSSLALCETPTQGLREMNGLIPEGKEWNITWCARTCTDARSVTMWGGYTHGVVQYTYTHTHTRMPWSWQLW